MAYFSTRNRADSSGQYISSVGQVTLQKHKELFIGTSSASTKVLGPGSLGHFDDTGVMGGSIILHEGTEYLFYCGWTRRATVPYEWSIGRARRKPGEPVFSREFDGPVIGSTPTQPFLHASPIVFEHNGIFHMFFLSGTEWFATKAGKAESIYRLRHAISHDLLVWERSDSELFEKVFERESQTSSAIFEWEGQFHMLFSYRDSELFREDHTKNYRIGHATSADLSNWTRQADVTWSDDQECSDLKDKNMQGYPSIFVTDNILYLLYCGDRFGEGGFFLARLLGDFSGTPLTGPKF